MGVPVLQTTTVPAGEALVADMEQFAAAFLRLGLVMQADDGTAGFEHNTTTFRRQERIGLACPRPAAGIVVSALSGPQA